jgi:hypothetical protein
MHANWGYVTNKTFYIDIYHSASLIRYGKHPYRCFSILRAHVRNLFILDIYIYKLILMEF